MTVTQLEVFIEIVKTSSFTKAGQRIGLTQSAVSHAVSSLEAELGISLMERTRTGIVITEVGNKIYLHALEILNRVDAIRQEANALNKILSTTIRLGSFPSVSGSILPAIISSFHQRFPQIDIVLFEGTDQEVLNWIEAGVVHIGFTTLPRKNLETIYITEDQMLLITSSNHQLAGKAVVSVDNISSEPFIMSKGGCEPHILEIFKQHQVCPDIKFEVREIATIVSMVQENLGISILPELALINIKTNISATPLYPPVTRKLGLAIKSLSDTTPAISCFIEHVLKYRK